MAATKPRKRLVVACDGTWVNSDNGLDYATHKLAVSSNVTRICRALLPRSEDGVPQVVYYQAGLGSQNNWYSHYLGGFLGEGIGENIREAYAFLCDNYEDGDDIILIGFSRGAFTARTVGGLVSEIGLLNKRGLGAFYPIFKDWENQGNPEYKPLIDSIEWPLAGRPTISASAADRKYLDKLVAAGLTRPGIPVKAIGVWDTVGTLGIPTVKIPRLNIPLYTQTKKEYAFINTEVAPNVSYAYQALALDEQRTSFSPTLWESPQPGAKVALKELKQMWFPGVHTSVGGGNADTSISDITLAWMMTQLSPHLAFDQDYIQLQRQQNVAYYERSNLPVKEWALGLIKRSDTGLINGLLGTSVRSPGVYNRVDPSTDLESDTALFKPCEFIHPSVRWRWKIAHGPGLAEDDDDPIGEGNYEPAALKGWTFLEPGPVDENVYGEQNGLKQWENYGKWVKKDGKGNYTFIVEEPIRDGSFESRLVDGWPGVKSKLSLPM